MKRWTKSEMQKKIYMVTCIYIGSENLSSVYFLKTCFGQLLYSTSFLTTERLKFYQFVKILNVNAYSCLRLLNIIYYGLGPAEEYVDKQSFLFLSVYIFQSVWLKFLGFPGDKNLAFLYYYYYYFKLEDSCFTMLYQFLLYNIVNQL